MARIIESIDDLFGVCYEFKMPWPPSVNMYWRAHGGRNILSKKGRAYKESVSKLYMLNRWSKQALGQRKVILYARSYPGSARIYDIDNIWKAPIDCLKNLDIIHDDSQIVVLIAKKCRICLKSPHVILQFLPVDDE